MQLQILLPIFVWLPPAGRSGPQPFVQSGDVPVVQVVTLSVTPPSTASSHDRSPLEVPLDVPPEVEPELEVVPELDVVPELEVEPPPDVEPPELEVVEIAPESALPVDGLLLLLQPVVAEETSSNAAALIVTNHTAFIVVSFSIGRTVMPIRGTGRSKGNCTRE